MEGNILLSGSAYGYQAPANDHVQTDNAGISEYPSTGIVSLMMFCIF